MVYTIWFTWNGLHVMVLHETVYTRWFYTRCTRDGLHWRWVYIGDGFTPEMFFHEMIFLEMVKHEMVKHEMVYTGDGLHEMGYTR